MKSSNLFLPTALRACLCTALYILLALPENQGQTLLEGSLQSVYFVDAKPQFFKIPDHTTAGYLYLRAEGADGGKRYNDQLNIKYAAGGEGATIKAYFPIGTGANQILPGADICVVIGHEGASKTGVNLNGGCGCGNYANPDWMIMANLQSYNTTSSPKDGYAGYRFANTAPAQFIQLAKDENKCFDLQNANTANGTNIQRYTCNNAASRQWSIKGANIQLFDCNSTNAQNWVYDGLRKNIRSGLNPAKCIDRVNAKTTDGNNIQLWDCNDITAQRWVIDGATLPTVRIPSIASTSPSPLINALTCREQKPPTVPIFNSTIATMPHRRISISTAMPSSITRIKANAWICRIPVPAMAPTSSYLIATTPMPRRGSTTA